MRSEVIADRYAQALLAAATEQNQAEAVLQQVGWYLKEAVSSCSPFLENPNIPRAAKEDLLAKLFPVSGEAHSKGALHLLIPLVRLLLRKGRIRYLPDIFRLYPKRYAQQKGVVTAKLYVAYPMEQSFMDRLQVKVSERLGKTVAFDVIQDPEILGGFIVATDTNWLDASVRRTLMDLGAHLKTLPVAST